MGSRPEAQGESGSPRKRRYAEGEFQHKVIISRGFYLSRYEITQSQWRAVMGTEPWKGEKNVVEGDDYPAVFVNWFDVQEFISRLNQAAGSELYRLPTEAEWEYAARANSKPGTSERHSRGKMGPVGQIGPNGFGLYDMLGNVWEWVYDWYDAEYYRRSPEVDPPGPEKPNPGAFRVLRGSGWHSAVGAELLARRHFDTPMLRDASVGFRLVFQGEVRAFYSSLLAE